MSHKKLVDTKSDVIDAKTARQALEYLFALQHISKKRLYLENFFRGIFFSLGSVVGFAVIGTLLLWILSLFDSLPFIETISQSIKNSIR